MLKNKNHRYHSVTFSIIFAAIMLAHALLFSFLQRFFFFGAFLKFDFSIIFIVANFLVLRWKYTIVILLARFFIAPSFSTIGYSAEGFLGQFVTFLVALIFIASIWFFVKVFKKVFQNQNVAMIATLIITILLTTFIINLVNLFLVNSLYFFLYEKRFISFWEIQEKWDNYKSFFLFMPNYYLGSFALYTGFNLILLLVSAIVIFPIWKVALKI
ncbi:MPN527 family putative ECF transporter permease subunit [Candidatus Mycoplasma pogonae]